MARRIGGVVLGACLLAGAGAATAADGPPDFTGVWGSFRGPGGRFGGGTADLPLTAEGRRRVEAYRALVEPTGDSPGGFCLGYGMPSSMLSSGGYPMEIVQHEDLLVVIYEAHSEIRHIYLRDRVADADLFPDRNGYSVGHWEGEKLIVETTHLKNAVDQRQFPHSDEARIVEEYELTTTNDGERVLVVTMTLTDPVFYTEPVAAEKRWLEKPNGRLLTYECNEPAWEEHLEMLREKRAATAGDGA